MKRKLKIRVIYSCYSLSPEFEKFKGDKLKKELKLSKLANRFKKFISCRKLKTYTMGLIIGGVVLGILGVILWIVKGKKAGKSASLELMDTSRIQDINENYNEITASMGSGSFTHMVEVKGQAHSDAPLESELSKEQVVYYNAEIEHEYEKLETRTDSDGNKEKKWVKRTETVSENERWADGFGVKDATGFIALDPKKSKFHAEKLYSNFEKGDPNKDNGGLSFKIKGFSMNIGSGNNKGIRTIGYRYTETGIRLGTPLYVVGDANDRDGSLQISKPKDKKDQFIVSVKSKDEFLGSIGNAVKGLAIGAYASWAIGAGLLVYGIISEL